MVLDTIYHLMVNIFINYLITYLNSFLQLQINNYFNFLSNGLLSKITFMLF